MGCSMRYGRGMKDEEGGVEATGKRGRRRRNGRGMKNEEGGVEATGKRGRRRKGRGMKDEEGGVEATGTRGSCEEVCNRTRHPGNFLKLFPIGCWGNISFFYPLVS